MAELAAAASIIGISTSAFQGIKSTYDFIAGMREAPSNVKRIASELEVAGGPQRCLAVMGRGKARCVGSRRLGKGKRRCPGKPETQQCDRVRSCYFV